jgi:hypothetical protein
VEEIYTTMQPFQRVNPADERHILVRTALEQAFSTDDQSHYYWCIAALAAALPLLEGVLPQDQHGASIVPHPHAMVKKTCPESSAGYTMTGLRVYDTSRACDNCDTPIREQYFWSCGDSCEVDFCMRCHEELEKLFADRDLDHVRWVVRFVDAAARHILLATEPAQRELIFDEFAFNWPTPIFEKLVSVGVGVADAAVVHIEDNTETGIAEGTDFWLAVGLVQMLYAANRVPRKSVQASLDHFLEGPKLSEDHFLVKGIDKCEAYSDWRRWCALAPGGATGYVYFTQDFDLSPEFTVFLNHYNLVPPMFRQQCVRFDVWSSHDERRVRPIEVHREPLELLQADFTQHLGSGFSAGGKVVLQNLKSAPELNGQAGRLKQFDTSAGRWEVVLSDGDQKRVKPANLQHAEPPGKDLYESTIGRALDVKFAGEPAQGPGVLREFVSLAMQCALDQSAAGGAPLWEYSPELRTYWFGESAEPAGMRACGALLGHAVLTETLLAPIFPEAVYALLLRGMGSVNVRPWTLADLAKVSPSMASGLEELVEYAGPDVADVYPLDWPRTAELAELEPDGRAEYVQGYVDWYFTKRFAAQAFALCEGFMAVVGGSRLLRSLVTPEQLEQIICGAEHPMDIAAVRSSAMPNGWAAGGADADYLEMFWSVVESLGEEDCHKFAVFVSASTRMPLKGWSDFELQVQKNGVGDDRLPTAYTCFRLLLLPLYSSKEVLQRRLLQAISETKGFGLS